MNLIKDNRYDIETLRLVGWTEGDGTGTDGYHLSDYFAFDGRYLGPDQHGIEPCVEALDDGLDLSAILALAGERKPLYFQYNGQTNEQPAYLELDELGNVDASYSGEIGNGVPMYVWHGRRLRWTLPNNLSGDAIIELVNAHRSLLARVHAGHSVEWDGNNYVGQLTDDALEARDELDPLLREAEGDIQVWPVVHWLFSSSTLRETWWDKPLADTVAELETHIDDNIELDGDIETALLDEAEELFDRSTRWGVEGNLNQIHVDALLADGRITAAQATQWKEEQE